MGCCYSQEGRQSHELLNEHDDAYFLKVENRNSVKQQNPRWWRRKIRSIVNKQLENHAFEEEAHRAIPTSESEPPPGSDAVGEISFSLSSPPSFQNASVQQYLSHSASFDNVSITPQKHDTSNAGYVADFLVKRKGRALQLRLAKHQFLQMVVTSSSSPNRATITPGTIDSGFFTEVDPSSRPIDDDAKDSPVSWPNAPPTSLPLRLISKEENINFNRSHGLIWKEIGSEDNVTAVAMNRISFDISSSQSTPRFIEPLMLAMGDENGNIVVTQIIDEKFSLEDISNGDNSLPQSNADLCSEGVEFSIEGRVRSLNFGSYEHLVVGGDGCYAWVLRIIVDASSQTPHDIVVVHKLERIDRIYAVRFSPDQKFLAIGGFDGKIALVPTTTVWNEDEQESVWGGDDDDSLLQVMKDSVIELDRPGLIYCLDWSPTGDYLAAAGSDKVCGIYNASNFESIYESSTRSTAIQDLQWSNDGKFLAIADREVAIIEGQPPFQIQCEISHTPKDSAMAQFRYRVTSLCWSPSGSFLAIGGNDGRCLLVETKGWALVYEYQRRESINALAWGQQIDEAKTDVRRYLAICDNDRTVALIKAGAPEQPKPEHGDDFSSVASSSYYSQSTMSSDWVLREDEFRDLDDVQEKMTRGLKSQNITAVAFSKTGKSKKTSSYLAYAADDCSLTIMTTRDWKAVFQVEFAKPIRSLVFSNSNNYLALGGDEGILNVLSVRSRTMIINSILSSPIKSIAFSKHDERLGVGLEDGILTLVSPESNWESVGEIDQSDSSICCQDWTSKLLACGRRNGSVSLFDTEKVFGNFFVPIAEFTGNLPVRSMAFAPSGRLLAIGGDNGVVSVLSAKGGWGLFNQINLGCSILAIRWSPAGRYVCFAGTDQTFRVYDTITWATVKEARESVSSIFATNNATSISGLDWSRDSKWMAIGGLGSGIHLVDTQEWTLLDL